MGFAAIFQAIAQGITNAYQTFEYIRENKKQAKEVAKQAQEQADERAKKAKYQMQQQKTSFLKSGVYFDSGSAADVINETYNTAMEDIQAINKDSIKAQKKLIRAGKTAFWTFAIDPAGNNGASASNIYQGFQSDKTNKTSNKTANYSTNDTKMSGGFENSKLTNTSYA